MPEEEVGGERVCRRQVRVRAGGGRREGVEAISI